MNKSILQQPFPRELVRERPGQNGRTLSYVETWAVVQRLNEGCDAWDFTVEKYEVLDGEVVVLGRLTADGVTKCAFGGSTITTDRNGAVVSIADDLKAAASDALKKAASLLGVGLELYSGQGVQPANNGNGTRPGNGRGPGHPGPGPVGNGHAAPLEVGDRATVRQLSAIHAASRRCGFGKERLASYVAEQTGKSDLSYLSRGEASSLIDSLNGGNGAQH